MDINLHRRYQFLGNQRSKWHKGAQDPHISALPQAQDLQATKDTQVPQEVCSK